MAIHHGAWELISTTRIEPAIYGCFRPMRILIANPKAWALAGAAISGAAIAFHAGEIEMRSWDDKAQAYEVRTRHCIEIDDCAPTFEIGKPLVLTLRVLAERIERAPTLCIGSLIVKKL